MSGATIIQTEATDNPKLKPVALNIRSIPFYLRQKLKVAAAEVGSTMEDLAIEFITDGLKSLK